MCLLEPNVATLLQYITVQDSPQNTATISQVRNKSYLHIVSITSVEVPQKGANDPAMTQRVMRTILIGASAQNIISRCIFYSRKKILCVKYFIIVVTFNLPELFDITGCNFMPHSSDRDILCILISNHPRQVAKYFHLDNL